MRSFRESGTWPEHGPAHRLISHCLPPCPGALLRRIELYCIEFYYKSMGWVIYSAGRCPCPQGAGVYSIGGLGGRGKGFAKQCCRTLMGFANLLSKRNIRPRQSRKSPTASHFCLTYTLRMRKIPQMHDNDYENAYSRRPYPCFIRQCTSGFTPNLGESRWFRYGCRSCHGHVGLWWRRLFQQQFEFFQQ